MADVKRHYADPTRPYPDEDGVLTSELSIFLEWCGMTQPLERIYITTCPLPSLSILLLLTVITHIPKLQYAKSLGMFNLVYQRSCFYYFFFYGCN